MNLFHTSIVIVIVCSMIEGFAQTCLKKSSLIENKRLVWIGVGVLLFVIEAVLYTGALKYLDISTAYPLGALCFVMVTFLSHWLLNETITPKRWIGISFIMCGCILIAL